MQRAFCSVLFVLALWGCAAHEVYEKAGMNAGAAIADWKECQRSALIATGNQATDVGDASTDRDRLIGRVVIPERTDGGMYNPQDYLSIKRREQLRQDCMKSKGFRFLGVPAVERM